MKRVLTTILMITIASVIFAGLVFAANTKGTVSASELNLRENASTSANAIDVLYRGAKVNIISEEGEWYKVKYNNEEGYVSKQYITKEAGSNNNAQNNNTTANNMATNENTTNSANTVENTTSNETTSSNSDNNPPIDVNEINTTKIKEEATIYVLPLISSTKLGKVTANTNVLLISVNGDWSYIQTENNNGWVLTKKLETTSTSLPTSTTTPTPEPTATPVPEPASTQNPEPTTTSEYPTTMYVNVEAVNVRSKANTSSEVVTSVGKNTAVTVEGKEGDWYNVKTTDGNGYIKSEYLSKTR